MRQPEADTSQVGPQEMVYTSLLEAGCGWGYELHWNPLRRLLTRQLPTKNICSESAVTNIPSGLRPFQKKWLLGEQLCTNSYPELPKGVNSGKALRFMDYSLVQGFFKLWVPRVPKTAVCTGLAISETSKPLLGLFLYHQQYLN